MIPEDLAEIPFVPSVLKVTASESLDISTDLIITEHKSIAELIHEEKKELNDKKNDR